MASRGVNKVILVGNAGNDPEFRVMPNGNGVANVSIATSEAWKDKNTGDQQEKTEWHNIVAWGKLAETIGEYVRKGSKVYVEGKLQTRSWESTDGSKRYKTEILANTVQFIDSKPQQDREEIEKQEQSNNNSTPTDEGDNDLPF